MASSIPKIYWDSSCFLAVLNQEEEASRCVTILAEAEQGKIDLIISPLSMAETVKPKTAQKPVSKENREMVLRFFDAPYMKMVNFNREMARLSLEYCWDQDLKPRDALHLAMAVHAGCEYFETKDSDFLRLAAQFKETITIRKPEGAGSMALFDLEES